MRDLPVMQKSKTIKEIISMYKEDRSDLDLAEKHIKHLEENNILVRLVTYEYQNINKNKKVSLAKYAPTAKVLKSNRKGYEPGDFLILQAGLFEIIKAESGSESNGQHHSDIEIPRIFASWQDRRIFLDTITGDKSHAKMMIYMIPSFDLQGTYNI